MTNPNNNKALFLDRDGTINIEKNYIYRIEDFEFTNGIIPLIKSYQKKEFLLFIITNQSGIARGYYSSHDVDAIHSVMAESFRAAGAELDAVYYCPHHPSQGCGCRKPETGMIDQARMENSFPTGGWIVGDAHSDMELGRRSGLSTILVLTGRGVSQLEKIRAEKKPEPDHITGSLVTAVDIILSTPLQTG